MGKKRLFGVSNRLLYGACICFVKVAQIVRFTVARITMTLSDNANDGSIHLRCVFTHSNIS